MAAARLSCAGASRAAPANLLNKTVAVATTITIPATKADATRLVASRNATRTVAISMQGRVSSRAARRAKGGSQDREIGPEQGGGALRLQGDRSVGAIGMIAGASRLTVTFDPSGTSCNASLIVGAGGDRPITWKGLNGVVMTATGKPSVSNISCSVSAGKRAGRLIGGASVYSQ